MPETQSTVNAAWGEEVTYGRVGTVSATGLTAGRYPQGTAEGATSFGVYKIVRERYTFDIDALGFDPKMRDTITPTARPAAGIARVITGVVWSTFLNFWSVDVQYPELASDLDQLSTVYRSAPTPTTAGLTARNDVAVYTATPCRLQPGARAFEPVESLGKSMVTRAAYTCIFGATVLLKAGDVIEVGGVKYEATGQQEIEGLGVLTFAECSRLEG